MKLLLISQYYAPEPFRIHEICEALAARGHQITVLTGIPNYPMGRVYPGYRLRKHRKEEIRGVQLMRVWTVPRKSGKLFRMLNYFSYPFSAGIRALGLDSSYDAVMVYQLSPVIMAWPGILYSCKNRTPLLLYCLDLWPASLVAADIRQDSLIYRAFHKISRNIYKKADRILVGSPGFTGYLRDEFRIAEQRISVLPQHAEDMRDLAGDAEDHGKKQASERDGTFQIVFAGNLGKAQNLDIVLDAAKLLPDVVFHIIGDGSELQHLKAEAGKNIRFYGRLPEKDLPVYFAKADALLVTLQADPALSLTLPVKVQTYMSAGKPILGAANGEISRVIREAQCGFCGNAEDAAELAENIRKLMESEHRAEMGRNARQYYETHYSKKQFLDVLEQELEKIAGIHRSHTGQ